MAACPRCTTENADGAATCSYCALALQASAPSASTPRWGAPAQAPAWGMQPYVPQTLTVYQPVWREGKKLVLVHGARLPDRCVKCNAPAEGYRLQRRLTWLHPAYLLLLFTGLILYAIVSAFASKTAEVEIGLCPKHRRQRWQAIAGGWTLGLIGALVLPWMAIVFEAWWLAALGGGMALVGMIGGLVVARQVAPSKIDDGRVWLRGVNPEYLGELPEAPPEG